MSTNEKTANEVIEELEHENERLRQIIRALLRDTNGQASHVKHGDSLHGCCNEVKQMTVKKGTRE